jgi:CspA family cold shock protein
MTTGSVKFFDIGRGFGFIRPDDGGKDAFVHMTAVAQAGLRNLNEGQRVSYTLEPRGGSKAAATRLTILD